MTRSVCLARTGGTPVEHKATAPIVTADQEDEALARRSTIGKERLMGIGGRRSPRRSRCLTASTIAAISVFCTTQSSAEPVVTRSLKEVSAPGEICHITCRRGWFAVDLEASLFSRPLMRLKRSDRSDFGPHFTGHGASVWMQPLGQRRDYLIYNVGRRHVFVRLFCERGR